MKIAYIFKEKNFSYQRPAFQYWMPLKWTFKFWERFKGEKRPVGTMMSINVRDGSFLEEREDFMAIFERE
jgi:hypothetical protein